MSGKLEFHADQLAPRKWAHLEMSQSHQTAVSMRDSRFNYEPLLGVHPASENKKSISFLGKELQAPLWISSMTGGTQHARQINTNLAQAAREFGLGMGLGSCRSILENDDRFADFHMRPHLGADLPLYANLGIAQIEQIIGDKRTDLIVELVQKLEADGLIIHINPLQEWAQPEGDRLQRPAIDTIEELISRSDIPLIVKEVGQGMGPRSLKRLLQLPLMAIEFGAFGGTNFTSLELGRKGSDDTASQSLVRVGHDAQEMLQFCNHYLETLGPQCRVKHLIISGGIKTPLDGHALLLASNFQSVYGLAGRVLPAARSDYETLRNFLREEISTLYLAQQFLELGDH